MSGSSPMAITMGDASGVGPEIVLRTCRRGGARRRRRRLRRRRDPALGPAPARHVGRHRAIDLPSSRCRRDLNVVDLGLLAADDHRPGELERGSGRGGPGLRRAGHRSTRSPGRVAGLVTMPMNKEATQLSDPGFVGHTELIAELLRGATGDDDADERPADRRHPRQHPLLAARGDRAGAGRSGARRDRADRTPLCAVPRRRRASRCAASTRTPASTGCSAPRTPSTSPRRSRRRRARASTPSGPHPADTVFHQAVHRDRYDAIVVHVPRPGPRADEAAGLRRRAST